ncbi:ZIP Zinc transporter [Moelleriella libera RCEF 2490]|uniref:ZIP Zinc transporter n=1 Tax=Moelleriella libera RCEF 2490 TaxID=1081109 RepID=A0A167WSI5_9HYPO|nr:ZIP Zinc transporter [Moelleriella libera RCEF 2490]
MDEPKPQCGTKAGESPQQYDLGIHVLGLFLVLAASCLGAGFPVAAKKISWLKVPPKVFFACKHFGTGVLIATAFVHLLPTAFGSLGDPCLPDLFIKDYPPLPGVIMMASMFILFVIEMWLNAKTGGHSHGGPTGNVIHSGTRANASGPPVPAPQYRPDSQQSLNELTGKAWDEQSYDSRTARTIYEDDTKRATVSTMPAWFIAFYEQYVRQHTELVDMVSKKENRRTLYQEKTNAAVVKEYGVDEEAAVDPEVYRRMSTNITLLEGGILFHSVFVGMTVSITIDGFIILLIAILFHQMFEGLGLGSRIAAVPYPKGSVKPWLLVFAFGTTAPIGQAIGLLTRNTYDPNSAFGLIIVGIFNAISSGLLIYAALVDLLAEDFLSEEANLLLSKKDKIAAFCWVLLGALGMSIVGAFA